MFLLPISEHFPVRLQLLLLRAETLEYALHRQLIIPLVTAWCSVFQSCKPLSLFSFRGIVILLSLFLSACVSAFFIFYVSANFFKQFLSVRWLCKFFGKAWVIALARGALPMSLQMRLLKYLITKVTLL